MRVKVPYAVKVYRLTEDTGQPVMLGTDMHVLMGEMEMDRCEWDRIKRSSPGALFGRQAKGEAYSSMGRRKWVLRTPRATTSRKISKIIGSPSAVLCGLSRAGPNGTLSSSIHVLSSAHSAVLTGEGIEVRARL